jgi:predicted lipid-binding transport protein (Tim44 family)
MDHGSMHQLMGGMGGDMMDGRMMGDGFMWFWAIFWVVVLALLVAGAIWLARTLTRPPISVLLAMPASSTQSTIWPTR